VRSGEGELSRKAGKEPNRDWGSYKPCIYEAGKFKGLK